MFGGGHLLFVQEHQADNHDVDVAANRTVLKEAGDLEDTQARLIVLVSFNHLTHQIWISLHSTGLVIIKLIAKLTDIESVVSEHFLQFTGTRN